MLHLFVNPRTVRAIVALPRDMLPPPPAALAAAADPKHESREPTTLSGVATATLRRPAVAHKVLMRIVAEMSSVDFRLLHEDGSSLALACVQNLTADVTMYAAHLAVDLSLGNLRLANHAVPSGNPYHWVCQTRVPTEGGAGQSLLNIQFVSSSNMAEPSLPVFSEGYNASLEVAVSQLAIVFQNYFLGELLAWVATLTAALAPPPLSAATPQQQPPRASLDIRPPPPPVVVAAATAMKMVVSLAAPVILMPADTQREDSLEVDLGYFSLTNRVLWDGQPGPPLPGVRGGTMVDEATLTFTGMKVVVISGGSESPNVFDELSDCQVTMCRPLADPSATLPPIDVAVNIRAVRLGLSNTNFELLTKCIVENFAEQSPRKQSAQQVAAREEAAAGKAEQAASSVEETTGVVVSACAGGAAPKTALGTTFRLTLHIDSTALKLDQDVRDAASHQVHTKRLARLNVDKLLFRLSLCPVGMHLFLSVPTISIFDIRQTADGTGGRPILGPAELFSKQASGANDGKVHRKDAGPPTLLMLEYFAGADGDKSVSASLQNPHLTLDLSFTQMLLRFFVPTFGGGDVGTVAQVLPRDIDIRGKYTANRDVTLSRSRRCDSLSPLSSMHWFVYCGWFAVRANRRVCLTSLLDACVCL
jgi:hypothetical protein